MYKDIALLDSNHCCSPEKNYSKLTVIQQIMAYLSPQLWGIIKNHSTHTHCAHQHLPVCDAQVHILQSCVATEVSPSAL